MEALAESKAATTGKRTAPRGAFELKGVMTSLAVMRLYTADLAQIERQLRIKISQLPQFFQAVPVVLDFGAMPHGGSTMRLAAFVSLLRACHLIPVGITNAGEDVVRIAVAVGLGVMPLRSGRTPARPAGVAESADITVRSDVARAAAGRNGSPTSDATETVVRSVPVAPPAPHRPPVVVRQPVRGGQVIYAQRTDLVVLAPVNPGAEVIADGHVHIYSTLRGRAVAGAQGLAEARIFCQRLEAELVAVAGTYLMADDIPRERRGLPSQIYVEGGECRVIAL